MSKKVNLRDRVVDGELDLSMCELQEVPVRDIAALKKATSLDLSINHLTVLSKSFATLTHLVTLDLSKNQIARLPENFGDLVLLRHLDLYSNQLAHLPLSFGQLRNLKWLDLKNNPLVPALAEVAGPCQDPQQCQACAKNVVKVIGDTKQRFEEEQRRLALLEKEKEMAEKAAAKKEQQKSKKANRNEKRKAEENGVKTSKEQVQQHGASAAGGAQKRKERHMSNKSAVRTPAKRSWGSVVGSAFKLLLLIILSSSMTLSFIYVVDMEKFVQVRNGAETLWNATVELLPREVVIYGKNTMELIRPTFSTVTSHLQSTLNDTSSFLNTDPRVKTYWTNLKDLSSAFSENLVFVLRTVYKQVPLLYDDVKRKVLG